MAKGRKTGGRRPGSLNHRTRALAACEEIGVNPFENIAKIANDEGHPYYYDANKELCQYLEPKLRAVDLTGDAESLGMKIVIEGYGDSK